MPTYISMLRGINVSGQKKINMKELKALYENAGYKNVQTYIQSGNVVFQSSKKSTIAIAKEQEQMIAQQYGFDVSVIVITPDELEKVITANPFIKEPGFEEGKMYVCFLADKPDPEKMDKIKDLQYNEDRFIIDGKTIYLFIPGGFGNTKLNNNFFEAKLKLTATTRNWNTVNKLLTIAKQI